MIPLFLQAQSFRCGEPGYRAGTCFAGHPGSPYIPLCITEADGVPRIMRFGGEGSGISVAFLRASL